MAEEEKGGLFEELLKTFYSAREAKLEIGRSKKLSTTTPPVITAEPDGILSDVSYQYVMGGQIDFILTERNNLIKQWRSVTYLPEVDAAIQELLNEALVFEEDDSLPLELNLDDLDLNDGLKRKILDSFDKIITLLDFKNRGGDLFKQWYVDGTLAVEAVYDNARKTEGLKKLILLPPYDFFKYKDIRTGETTFFYSTRLGADMYNRPHTTLNALYQHSEIKYKPEQITQINSNIFSQDRLFSISHLNKAMKVINQVTLIEDSIIIYRITRAPEKKVFYIDTGRLPKGKAEEYIQNMMKKHRQKMVYNIDTGNIENRKRSISLLEDFWMPRSQDGKGTEIEILQGLDSNMSEIPDLDYFYDKMYRALNVPSIRRKNEESQFRGLQPGSFEIEREEIKFFKFVVGLRKKFNQLFLDLLKKELIATKIVSLQDWEKIKTGIKFNYKNNNEYAEIKNLQTMESRFNIADTANNLVETHLLSKEWIRREILKQNDDERKIIDSQIEDEAKTEAKLTPPEEEGF